MKRALTILIVFLAASAAQAQSWKVLRWDAYGFAMLAWPGTEWDTHALSNGWVMLRAQRNSYRFGALVALGYQANALQLENSLLQISADTLSQQDWSPVKQGGGWNGWYWWRMFQAEQGRNVYLAVLGAGPRGSYILSLRTTRKEFERNAALYKQWMNSLTLY